MLKKLLPVFLLIISSNIYAQINVSKIDTVTTPYCRVIMGSDGVISSKTKIFALVDFGFRSVSKAKIPDPFLYITDTDENKMYFSGPMEIVNLFYTKGWELMQVTHMGDSNVEMLLKRKMNKA